MEQKYLSLTWDDIYEQCKTVSVKIKTGTFFPDILISVGRGGMIPARILSDLLGVKNVMLYNIRMYTGVNTVGNVVQSFSGNIYKQNILLVDDIIDTGKTIDCAMGNLLEQQPKSIRVASLLCKKHIVRKPSYYADDCDNDVWIIYPWEKNEFPISLPR